MAINTSGMKLTFRDEFDSFSSSPGSNYGVWNTGGNTADATNGRNLTTAGMDVYFSDASVGYNPYSVENGILTIDAIKGSPVSGLNYTSGMMNTRGSFSQQYGYFEMSAKLPTGKGFWPAWWMVRADGLKGVEIDMLEAVGASPDRIVNTVHTNTNPNWNAYSHGTTVSDTDDAFHTYAVNWTPSRITFYFDGQETYSTPTPSDLKAPMYMIANFGIGAPKGWGGAPNAGTPFPGEFQIDYIRAYDNGYTTNVSGRAAVGNEDRLGTEITLTTGAKVVLGDNDWNVSGAPSSASVRLGDGDITVNLSGWGNKVTLGDGDHRVTLTNDGHALSLGDGNSMIMLNGSSNVVNLGDTAGTVIRANGYHETISQDGDGKVTLGGTTGATTVTLGDGDHVLTLGGSNNSVTVGDGNSVIVAGTMNSSVVAGDGDSRITIAGWNNTVDAGGGNDVILGGKGHSTYVLDWVGKGRDTIHNFVSTDKLDLGKALDGLGVKADLSNIRDVLAVTLSDNNTVLSVDADRNAATKSVDVATLLGVQRSLDTLLKAGNIVLGHYERPDDVSSFLSLDGITGSKTALAIRAADLSSIPDGAVISVDNFGGAGRWYWQDNDFLSLRGFGEGSTLTFDHTRADGLQIYGLHDTGTGNDYTLVIESLNGARLVSGDYNFY